MKEKCSTTWLDGKNLLKVWVAGKQMAWALKISEQQNHINMSTFKQIYLAYILICMVCHFISVAMSYRRAKSKI